MSYAVEYAKERVKACYGRLKIEWELRGRGIEQDLVDAALDCVADTQTQAALAALRVKYRNKPDMDDKEKGRAYNFLLRRGFTAETSEEAIRLLKNP